MSITGSDLDESIKTFELAKQYPDCLVSTAVYTLIMPKSTLQIHLQKLRHYLNWKKLNT